MTAAAIPAALDRFVKIWCTDFEYVAPPGERPVPICCCALELRSGRLLRLWGDAMRPLPIGPDDLTVAFYSSAELGSYRAAGQRFS